MFYRGGITALNVDQFTIREIDEHIRFMDKTLEEVRRLEHEARHG